MPTVNRIIGCPAGKGMPKMNLTPLDKQIQIISALAEGNSIRATARMVGVEHKTVMRVLLRVGDACARLLNEKLRRIRGLLTVCGAWRTYLHGSRRA